jgi:Myb-like DNA-binding domain
VTVDDPLEKNIRRFFTHFVAMGPAECNNAAPSATTPSSLGHAVPSRNGISSLNNNDVADDDNLNKWSKNGYGVPVTWQPGRFTRDETELIKKAISEYCARKEIPVTRLCAECDHKSELKGAWMEIAQKLPHRSVQSVYRHGIRQCHPFRRGAWSKEEVVALHAHVASLGKKWSTIQGKLNRSADSCRDKYREMPEAYIKGRWKNEETDQLKRHIKDFLKSNVALDPVVRSVAGEVDPDFAVLGLFVAKSNPPIHIPWNNISKKMSQRSRLSCFKKWQKLTGLIACSDPSVRDPSSEHNLEMKKFSNSDRKRCSSERDDAVPSTCDSKRQKLDQPESFVRSTRSTEQLVDAALASAPMKLGKHIGATRTKGSRRRFTHEKVVAEDPKVEYDAAEVAAETVEAVDLPNITAGTSV